MRKFSLVVYGVIAALGIFRGIKDSLVIFQLGGMLSIFQWSKLLLSPYVILRVLCPLVVGLLFAMLFLRQWKSGCSNRSITVLWVLYFLGFFFGGWLPLISLSAVFPTSSGFRTEVADFLSRFTSPESMLLGLLILVILLRRGENGASEQEKMHLSTGILVIGSLAWDTRGGRRHWWTERLNDAGNISCKVRVPIRYGRLSNTENGKSGLGTYTMVFARLADCPLGDAKVFSCISAVSNFEDLWREARWLWAAEVKKADDAPAATAEVASRWGCVALLPNPVLQNDPEKAKFAQMLCAEWARKVGCQSHYFDDQETRLLTPEGLLKVNWSQFDASGGVGLPDLLLATTNTPCPQVPSVDTIVLAWHNDVPKALEKQRDPYVGYFWCNYHNGFRTFEDEEIKRRLNDFAGALGDPGKCVPPRR